MWKRVNETKAMLNHVRAFQKAMLEIYEASLVTAPATKKRKTAGTRAELNKYWVEKGCKKYPFDNKRQKGVREEYWPSCRERIGPAVYR